MTTILRKVNQLVKKLLILFLTILIFLIKFITMNTKFNLFAHSLYGPTHSELVIPFSLQLNSYSKVQHKYEWMVVFSIKSLFWEFGFAVTKLDTIKMKKFHNVNGDEINYSEEPCTGQITSVPEKQIGDE